jgi:hypothetical protein
MPIGTGARGLGALAILLALLGGMLRTGADASGRRVLAAQGPVQA